MEDGYKKTSSNIYIILIILIIGVAVLLLLPENNDNNGGNNNNNGGTNPGGQIINPGGTNPGGTNPGGSGTQDEPSTLILTLKGEQTIKIQKGEKYVEPGYTATDSIEGDLTSKVTTKGQVDNTKAGSYHIIYIVQNSKGEVKQAIRIVTVTIDASDAKIKITSEPTTLTNKDVTVTLKVTGEGYDYTTLPDGKKETKANITYKIAKNGTYTFKIKRKDGKIVKKEVKITNIDKTKPTVTCKSIVMVDKTEIIVTAKDDSGIKNYNYTVDSKKYASKEASYIVKGSTKNIAVTAYDNAANYTIASCISLDYKWPKKITEIKMASGTPKNYDKTLRYKNLNYMLYYPDDMNIKDGKNAMIVFLHGAGECGTNINGMFNENTAFVNDMKTGTFKEHAIYVAPQCNCQNRGWGPCYTELKELIDKLINDYNVNPKKVSITGHSAGGAAAFRLLMKYPNFFASTVLVAPSDGETSYNILKNEKIVIYAGDSDVRIHKLSTEVSRILKYYGVNIEFYSLYGLGHAIQPYVYNKTNSIEWMIAQTK